MPKIKTNTNDLSTNLVPLTLKDKLQYHKFEIETSFFNDATKTGPFTVNEAGVVSTWYQYEKTISFSDLVNLRVRFYQNVDLGTTQQDFVFLTPPMTSGIPTNQRQVSQFMDFVFLRKQNSNFYSEDFNQEFLAYNLTLIRENETLPFIIPNGNSFGPPNFFGETRASGTQWGTFAQYNRSRTWSSFHIFKKIKFEIWVYNRQDVIAQY
jgi:hypothetical protein